MSQIEIIATALAPIVFVTGLGWFAGVNGIMPEKASGVLATFVVKFALPFSLFLAAATAKREDILNPALFGTLCIGLLGTLALAYAVGRLAFGHTTGEAAMQGLVGSFANMAYCGPPVLGAVAGSASMLCIVMGNLILAVFMLPAMMVLIAHGERDGGGVSRSLIEALKQPIFYLPVIGLALAVLRVQLPGIAHSAVDQIGRASGGAALFTLGLVLSGIRFRLDRDIIVNVAIKNFVQPAAFLGLGLAFGLEGNELKGVFLLGILPSATAVPALALAHRTYANDAAATVLASTVLSILTISAGIAIAGVL